MGYKKVKYCMTLNNININNVNNNNDNNDDNNVVIMTVITATLTRNILYTAEHNGIQSTQVRKTPEVLET